MQWRPFITPVGDAPVPKGGNLADSIDPLVDTGGKIGRKGQAEFVEGRTIGAPRPFHIDEEAAARSVFGGLKASAAHAFAIFIFLTDKAQPPIRALAGLGYDELSQPNPVRPGDELDFEATVLEKRESKSRPGT